MAIRFRKQAIKLIEKADPDTLSRIQEKLNQLLTSVEAQSIIPFTELDIKQMKGEWEGFYRLRVGMFGSFLQLIRYLELLKSIQLEIEAMFINRRQLTDATTPIPGSLMLRDRALNDPDEQLREWAQEQLRKMEER